MLQYTALCLLALAVLCAGSDMFAHFKYFDCCNSAASYFCPHCYGCKNKPLENLNKVLTSRIFGQDKAIEQLFKAFKTRGSHALTIHIAGDNGVGKSYAAKNIANALYYDTDKAFLYLRGEQYQVIML